MKILSRLNIVADKEKKPNPFKVGDILSCTWGYSMIIVDFYRVVKVLPSSVKIEKLQQKIVSGDDGFQGRVVPTDKAVKSGVDGKTYRVLFTGDGEPCLKIESYAYARPWDGLPKMFDRMD